jgi:uroporphyrinogen decarboxylase
MRQAGRFLPEYLELRKKHTLLELIREPELAVQVTLMPIKRFNLDAAILFSDLLPPLAAMGLGLEFVKDEGPRIGKPIRSPRDVDMMPVPVSEDVLPETFATIKLLRPELDSLGIPLIGFAGAPFTLAAYAIEGSGSKNYEIARRFMLAEPSAWQRLMKKLATFQADYLLSQAKAGAQVLQVFDSWVGVLGKEEYQRFVQPYNQQLFQTVRQAGVPIIHFSTRTASYIETIAADGADVISVDAQLPLHEIRERLGWNKPVQGNLEPLALLAPWRELQYRTDAILAGNQGRPGHIFNVGHGIVPATNPDQLARLIDYVHEKTAEARHP